MDKKKRQAIEKGKNGEQGKGRGKAAQVQAPAPEQTQVQAASDTGAVETVKKEAKEAKVIKGNLPKLPRMSTAGSGAKRTKKEKPLQDCTCGCGTPTRSQWAPGHDARAKGWALRVERNIMTIDDVPANERKGAEFMLKVRKELVAAGAGTESNIKLVRGKKGKAAEGEGASLDPAQAVNE